MDLKHSTWHMADAQQHSANGITVIMVLRWCLEPPWPKNTEKAALTVTTDPKLVFRRRGAWAQLDTWETVSRGHLRVSRREKDVGRCAEVGKWEGPCDLFKRCIAEWEAPCGFLWLIFSFSHFPFKCFQWKWWHCCYMDLLPGQHTVQLLHELVKLRWGHLLTAQEAALDMLICWWEWHSGKPAAHTS